MKVFWRDMKVLKSTIKYYTKELLIINFSIIFISIFITVTIYDQGNYLLHPYTILTMMLIMANSTMIGMFFYNYFTAWKQEIAEAFKEIELENKYEFIKDRFNR